MARRTALLYSRALRNRWLPVALTLCATGGVSTLAVAADTIKIGVIAEAQAIAGAS
ncbi:MAG: hypothetical protein H7340_17780, partial [Variovorax sp.]|nr:hypothetical protein [Variovorax sp.]